MQQIKYKEILDTDKWRVPIIKEAIEMMHGDVIPPDGWTKDELDEILHYACTQKISSPLLAVFIWFGLL